MPSVLLVCTANRCRSPMAMALLRARVASTRTANDWQIESAGVWTEEGYPALEDAQIVMAEKGYDLSTHQSRQVTGELLRSFQLILVMERGQKEALQVEFPDIANRVYLLTEMAGYVADIRDPVGKSQAAFREAADNIESIITIGFDQIVSLAQ